MKAVPVLLFLALAHGIGASILKSTDRLIDDLDFLRLKPLLSENQWFHPHPFHQHPWQHNAHKQEENRDQKRGQVRPSYWQNLKWDQTREPQYKEKLRNTQEQEHKLYEKPSFDMDHNQQLEEQMRKQYPLHKQQQYSQENQPTQPNLISYSTKRRQSSQESQDWSRYNNNAKKNLDDDIHGWIPQGSSMSWEDQNIANNNVIERKVHMDDSSSISAQDKEELEKSFSDAQKAMKQLSDKEQMQFHQALEHEKQHNQNAEANATPLAQKHQYPIEQYKQPLLDMNHHQQPEDQMRKQYPSHKQQKYSQQKQPTQRNLISFSSKSSQSSQESQEKSQDNENDKKNLNDDFHGWIPEDSAMSSEDQNIANNNVIERKVDMDDSSSISALNKAELEKRLSDAQKAMKQLSDKEQMQFNQALEQEKQHNQDAEANATQLAQKHQYPTEQYKQPSLDMNHHKQPEDQMRKQYPSHKQQQYSQQNQPAQRNLISFSSKSSQSSQESQEKSQDNENDKKNLNDDFHGWIPEDSAMSSEDHNIANKDVSERKVDMDDSSSILALDKAELEKRFSDAQKAMKQLSDKEQMQFHQALEHEKQHNQDAEANATQLAQKHQYPTEQYKQPSLDMNHHKQPKDQMRKQYPSHKQQQYSQQNQPAQRNLISFSSKSSQSSQESQEKSQYNDNDKKNLNDDFHGWIPEDSAMSPEDYIANNDVIERKNRMDDSTSNSAQDKEELEKRLSDAKKAMKKLSDKGQMQFHQALEQEKQHNQDAEVNAIQLAQKHPYPMEEHILKTDDGHVTNKAETMKSMINHDLHTDKILNGIKLESPSIRDNRETLKSNSTRPMNSHHLDVSYSVSAQGKEELEKIFSEAQKAMKQLSDKEQMQFHLALEHAKRHNLDAEANATQLAQRHQYPIEEHIVKTDDGYILTLFRITPKIQPRIVFFRKPVVFLMHGIDGSADDWLLMGPKKSLAYLLSDAGYDVWLGNARGNKYSKKHVSMHPAVSCFWQYSIDEIALHDLPAMIDYALEISKQKKMFYVGHSQGNTAFFALSANRPEYSDKIMMMYALSPIVYMNNARSPLFRMMSPLSNFYNRLQQQLGNGPFSPNKEFIRAVGGAMLEALTGCKNVSSNMNFVLAGVNVSVSDAQLLSLVMQHLPAGTSSMVIKHYGQVIASQGFRRYDYGPEVNMNVYGKEQPPRYEMEKVKAPVSLYYSEDDWLAHPKDVERLEKELPNVKESHKLSETHFGNMDFQFSSKAPEMVYKSLMESMQNNL